MINREALEQQLRDLEGRKRNVIEGENPDQVAVVRLDAQISEVRQQLSVIDAREANIDEKVSAEVVPFSILGINLDGYPTPIIELLEEVYRTTRKYTLNESAAIAEYEVGQIEQKLFGAQTELNIVISANVEIKGDNERLQQIKTELELDNRKLLEQNNEMSFQLNDAISKRDAAAAELGATIEAYDRANHTIEDLNEKIAEYERNAEYAERQEQPLTLSQEESTSLQEKADVVKKLFLSSENWGSSEKLYLPDGSFTVIPRKELEEWQAADIPEAEEPVVNEVSIEAPQLPVEIPDADTGNELAGHSTETESIPDHDGGETFEQSTQRRLAMLETAIFGEIKAVA